MPKLSHYTVVGDKLFCLNESTGKLVEVILKDVPINLSYEKVAVAMLCSDNYAQKQGEHDD